MPECTQAEREFLDVLKGRLGEYRLVRNPSTILPYEQNTFIGATVKITVDGVQQGHVYGGGDNSDPAAIGRALHEALGGGEFEELT